MSVSAVDGGDDVAAELLHEMREGHDVDLLASLDQHLQRPLRQPGGVHTRTYTYMHTHTHTRTHTHTCQYAYRVTSRHVMSVWAQPQPIARNATADHRPASEREHSSPPHPCTSTPAAGGEPIHHITSTPAAGGEPIHHITSPLAARGEAEHSITSHTAQQKQKHNANSAAREEQQTNRQTVAEAETERRITVLG